MIKYFTLIFLFVLVSKMNAQTTYFGNVRPVIQNHCMPCHESKNIGSIVLNNYFSVKAFANMINEVVNHKIMPPYQLDLSDCNEEVIHNNLSNDEITIIRNWINEGYLEGEVSKNNVQPYLIKTPLDSIVFTMKDKFEVAVSKEEHTQIFVLPNLAKTDIYVKRIEFFSGIKTRIKSAVVHIDTSHRSEELDKTDRRYGYTNYSGPAFVPKEYSWYGWNPYNSNTTIEEGFMKIIPANSKLLLQITYKEGLKPATDSMSKIVVWFSKELPNATLITSDFIIDTTYLIKKPFIIKKNEYKTINAERIIVKDMLIHAISPQGQNLLQSYKIFAISKNKESLPILSILKWDSHMKTKYHFKQPMRIEKGDKIIIEATYNFTEENTTLPLIPLGRVLYGNGSRDELFLVSFDTSDLQ